MAPSSPVQYEAQLLEASRGHHHSYYSPDHTEVAPFPPSGASLPQVCLRRFPEENCKQVAASLMQKSRVQKLLQTRRRSCVADRVLVLQLGVRPVPLRWESRVQDIGPPEASWLHVISNGKSSPRDLHLNAKTQLHSMTSKLPCWTPYAKQLARQEHNHTH